MMRSLALLASLTVIAQVSLAEEVDEKATEAAVHAFGQGRYLQATDALAEVAFAPDGTARDQFSFQMWEQISATITDELDLAVLRRSRGDKAVDPIDPKIATATARDAIAEIVERARRTRVVVLNEVHYSPRDRAFALAVARALRPLGFTMLAAEALSDEPAVGSGVSTIERLRRDGFARMDTGFYTRDPVFAGYLREAIALGYRPVAYEQTSRQRPQGSGIAAREQAQASNLAALIAAAPDAKFLVHVGFSHVAERPIEQEPGKKIEWMAARLKRLTGIDPLTIDQTTVTDLSLGQRASYIHAASLIGARPGVLYSGKNPLIVGPYAGAVDLQVVHPQRSYRLGRPVWRFQLGGAVPIPPRLLPPRGRRLIQAFAADAPADAIPLDQVVVTTASVNPIVIVPRGAVKFKVQP